MVDVGLAQLDKLIGGEESSWHEYNLELASNLLGQFSHDDWINLQQSVFSHPPYLQERCAEAVGHLGNEGGEGVLISLLTSPSMQVAAIAVSQLDDMNISLPKIFENKLMEILDYVSAKKSLRRDDVLSVMLRLV